METPTIKQIIKAKGAYLGWKIFIDLGWWIIQEVKQDAINCQSCEGSLNHTLSDRRSGRYIVKR